MPRAILLVGGPGNGKTEAIEVAIGALDREYGTGQALETSFRALFNRDDGQPVPRLATAAFTELRDSSARRTVTIVQDASSPDRARPGLTPARLFLEDLAKYSGDADEGIYLACVNRGILDDARIAAVAEGATSVAHLIEATIRSVSLSANPMSCWPLDGYPRVGVWPMDVESLVAIRTEGEESAAAVLLDRATDKAAWVARSDCPAGEMCPHCESREVLSEAAPRTALLTILHWYELASGKRWSFRDLNSMYSYLLAGPHSEEAGEADPCEWAAGQVGAAEDGARASKARRELSPFLLVAAQYQHALFSRWDSTAVADRWKDLRLLKHDEGRQLVSADTIEGLLRFLGRTKTSRVPATLAPLLRELCDTIDPAIAAPEVVFHRGDKMKTLHDLDSRFSQSVDAGLEFVRRHRWLSAAETQLLRRLSEADIELSNGDVRRPAPAAASRLQLLIRDFSCRLVRRSIGVRHGFAKDEGLLRAYQGVVEGNMDLMHATVRQVESLLNRKDRFELCLNTTFGEPPPPVQNRAMLSTLKQKVRATNLDEANRPRSMTRFLQVGSGASRHSVPLTFELFKAVSELQRGMLAASLSRPTVALLDTTKARLAGGVVRDPDALDDAGISLGLTDEVVTLVNGHFVVQAREEP